MSKLPEPPPLDRLKPDERTIAAAVVVWRIYFRGGAHPTTWNTFRAFGPTEARFDHHDEPAHEQRRAIYYAAVDAVTCVAEFFQQRREIDRRTNAPWLVGWKLTRELVLLDLGGTWPTRAGASMAINTAPHARCRRWSRAIWAAYPKLDGLCYCSSMHANQPALALYERARDALPARPVFHRALADPVLYAPLAHAARTLGYDLL